MRLLFTGGGTGGHVLPNIAIIHELKKSAPQISVSYVGCADSIEESLVRHAGVYFHAIHAGKMRRYLSLKNIADAGKTVAGFVESVALLRRLKPDLVFSKGGFVSVPVALAARVCGIPVWLHESDVSPGLANKITMRVAKKIFVSFEESVPFFKGREVEVVGNPVRAAIAKGKKEKALKILGFAGKRPIVLFMGGSLGAATLNSHVQSLLPELLKKYDVIHVTGKMPSYSSLYPLPATLHRHYRSYAFLGSELSDCYAAADVVMGRAGSGSIFEILANNKPMILVPLPTSASRGDQIENAAVFEKHGWARVIPQRELSAETTLSSLAHLAPAGDGRLAMIKAQHAAEPLLHGAERVATALKNSNGTTAANSSNE